MLYIMHTIVTIVAKYAVAIPVLALVVLFWRLDWRRRKELLVLLVVCGILTALLVKLGTTVHQDPRPFLSDGVTPYFAGSTDNGFPSDHTAFSALIAFVTLRYSTWLGIGLTALSLLIGTARVVAGVHHGQDIAGGFAIAAAGSVLGMGVYELARRSLKRGGRTV